MHISKGIQYMLLATFLFSCMNALVKLVPHIPAVEVVFFRCVISLIMSYGVLRAYKVPIWGNNKPLLIARGGAGAIALVLYFSMLQQIPLATVVTLQFLAPIFTAALGVFLLKEKVKAWQWVFFLLSFCGMLVVNGFDSRIGTIHLLMGVLAALGSGMAYNIIRKLKSTEHPLVIVMYFPLVTLPLSGIYSVWHWEQPAEWDWIVLLGIGVLTQFAQYFMTKAYQAEEVSKVANLKYLSIVYALLIGFVFFGEAFNVMSYLGMALVIIGVILNIWYKQRISAKEDKQERKKMIMNNFAFLCCCMGIYLAAMGRECTITYGIA